MRLAIRALVLVLVLVAMATATAAHAAPCFPHKRTVRLGAKVWELQGYFDDDWKPAGPRGTWGTCTMDDGVLREADGTVVASVYCGASIKVPGIVDDRDISVGMRGERVLAAYGDGPSSTLVCGSTYEEKVRRVSCWIPPPRESNLDRDWGYVVAGRLPKRAQDEDGLVRGEKALAFFRTRTIVEIVHRGSCH